MMKQDSADIDLTPENIELARQGSPRLYRQVLALCAIPRYARRIRIVGASMASLLLLLSVAIGNLDFTIEAVVLLILLVFPAFIRSLALGLYHATSIATVIGQRLRQLIHHSPRNN